MRKILIIVENLPVPFDTRVWQEATTLTKNGYLVSVICPTGKGYDRKYENIDGVHIYRHNLPTEGNGIFGYFREYWSALFNQIKLAKKIYKTHGFDVIHGCNPPDNIYIVAKKFKKYGVKYVFDHHDICPELSIAKFGLKSLKSKLIYRSQLYFERQTYKKCDFAFVTNNSYKDIAIKRGKMCEDNVMVLRSGPDLTRLRIQKPIKQIKRNKTFMIGYLGVIGQQEGIEYILESARYIRNSIGRNDIHWAVVGGGPHLEYLKNKAIDMRIDDIVEFTGRVSDQKLLDYLNTADVCVNSDTYNEMNDKSTMNKILEYMTLGKPIVQFDLTEGKFSAQEASLYAKNNDYVDMSKKILLLLNDEELRKKMGQYGRKRILNELSWEHTSENLLNGYDKIFKIGKDN